MPTSGDHDLQGIDAGAEELDGLAATAAAGKLRGSLPNVNSTALSSTMPPATVAISQALEPRDANGRTSVRSTSRPKARAQQERPRRRQPAAANPAARRTCSRARRPASPSCPGRN